MSAMFICLTALAVVLTLAGIVGSIMPALPGPPFSWAALVIVYFTCAPHVSLLSVSVTGILTLLAAIFDYVAPAYLTKLGGGSRKAVIGSSIGVVAGLFFMPYGLIVGPLVGSFIGEMMATNQTRVALRVASLSFLSFLITSGIKLILSASLTYLVLVAIIKAVSG